MHQGYLLTRSMRRVSSVSSSTLAVVDRRCTVEPASPPWTERRLSGIQKNLHVEVNDVITWYKINVGIGRKTFFVNLFVNQPKWLCKFPEPYLHGRILGPFKALQDALCDIYCVINHLIVKNWITIIMLGMKEHNTELIVILSYYLIPVQQKL